MARADLFDDSDPMSTLMRSIDWGATRLGPVEAWPDTLATALGICLASRFPIVIGWGPELLLLYNEAYRPILGAKHPHALGRPCYEAYEEVVSSLKPMLDGVPRDGRRHAGARFSLPPGARQVRPKRRTSPSRTGAIRDHPAGPSSASSPPWPSETTERVLSMRRLQVSSELARRFGHASGAEHACRLAAEVFEEFHADIPWSALYLVEDQEARLVASSRVEAESLPARLDLAGPSSVARAARDMRPIESTLEAPVSGHGAAGTPGAVPADRARRAREALGGARRGAKPAARPRRGLSKLLRVRRPPDRDGHRQRRRERRRARAREGPRRDRPGEDDLLQQREPRVSNPAHPPPRPPARRPREPVRPRCPRGRARRSSSRIEAPCGSASW